VEGASRRAPNGERFRSGFENGGRRQRFDSIHGVTSGGAGEQRLEHVGSNA
jgi:hypothetical protein